MDTGYAILGNDQDDNTVWATDYFDIKLYIPTTGSRRVYMIDKEGIHMGYMDEVTRTHTQNTVTLIPGAHGSPPTEVGAAMFEFPTKAGHAWFNTQHFYDVFGLNMFKTGASWFQKKKKGLRHLGVTLQPRFGMYKLNMYFPTFKPSLCDLNIII